MSQTLRIAELRGQLRRQPNTCVTTLLYITIYSTSFDFITLLSTIVFQSI